MLLKQGFIVLAGGSREGKETSGRERDGVRVSICGVWAMAGEKPPLEICKGVNDLDKVVALRDARGSSAEARSISPFVLL